MPPKEEVLEPPTTLHGLLNLVKGGWKWSHSLTIWLLHFHSQALRVRLCSSVHAPDSANHGPALLASHSQCVRRGDTLYLGAVCCLHITRAARDHTFPVKEVEIKFGSVVRSAPGRHGESQLCVSRCVAIQVFGLNS